MLLYVSNICKQRVHGYCVYILIPHTGDSNEAKVFDCIKFSFSHRIILKTLSKILQHFMCVSSTIWTLYVQLPISMYNKAKCNIQKGSLYRKRVSDECRIK